MARLQLGDAAHVRPQCPEHRVAPRVVGGQDVEQLDRGQHRPAVRPRPIELGVLRLVHVPAVGVEPGLRVPQVPLELEHLPHRIVEPDTIAGERAHLREGRHAHVEVVGPQRLRLRALACQRAVREPELPVRDVLAPVVDHRQQVRAHSGPARLDERRAHRARVV